MRFKAYLFIDTPSSKTILAVPAPAVEREHTKELGLFIKILWKVFYGR